MAQLSQETLNVVFELQRRLLEILDQATGTSYLIFERYGEIDAALTDLEQMDNTKERAVIYYNRLHTLLRVIAETQPVASSVILGSLAAAIAEAQFTADALEVTVAETKKDWHLS
jgi:hypothetical protein